MHDELGGPLGAESGRAQSGHVSRPDPLTGIAGLPGVQQDLGVDQGGRLRQEGDGSLQAEEGSIVAEAAKVPVTHGGSYRNE